MLRFTTVVIVLLSAIFSFGQPVILSIDVNNTNNKTSELTKAVTGKDLSKEEIILKLPGNTIRNHTVVINDVKIQGEILSGYKAQGKDLTINKDTRSIKDCNGDLKCSCAPIPIPFVFRILDSSGKDVVQLEISNSEVKDLLNGGINPPPAPVINPNNNAAFVTEIIISPYDDAANIVKNNTNKSEIIKIVNPYLSDKVSTFEALLAQVADNKYLYNYLNNLESRNQQNLKFAQSENEIIPTGFNLPTIVAEGVAGFIAKRFKEELTVSFFREFKNSFCETKGELYEFSLLIPRTTDVICSMDPYAYNTFLPFLRYAFELDFTSSPKNIRNFIISNTKYNINYKREIITGLDIVNLINEKQDKISEIIDNLDNELYITQFDSLDIMLKNTLISAAVLSRNSRNNKNNYIEPADWLSLVKNENHLQLFLGLVMLNERGNLMNIKIGDSNVYDLLNSYYESEFVKKIKPVIVSFNEISSQIKRIDNFIKDKPLDKDRTKFSLDDFLQYSELIISTVEVGNNTVDRLFPGTSKNEIFIKFKTTCSDFAQLVTSIDKKDWGGIFSTSLHIIYTNIPNLKDNTEFARYGTFMVAILNAKNSDDVENALDAAAEPVGSWRNNREKIVNINLNAFAGTMYSSMQHRPYFKGKLNFLAPVGFELTWRSFSIYVPIADLGPIVNLRINNSNAILPQLRWGDLFSPGLYGVWNIPAFPLSIGGGFQYAPRYSVNNLSEPILKNQLNYNIFVAVDIPIFNFYTY